MKSEQEPSSNGLANTGAQSVLPTLVSSPCADSEKALDAIPDGYARIPKEGALHYMRMCESAKSGPMGGHLECEEDPTCLHCIPQWKRDRASLVTNAYFDQGLKAKRQAIISGSFPDPASQDMIILMAVNWNGVALFFNWLCSCEVAGAHDCKERSLVVATDLQTYEILSREGVAVLSPELFNDAANASSKSNDPSEKIGGFMGSMAVHICMMHELVSMGYTVLSHDADVVWRTDPRPMLRHPAYARIDVQSELAPSWSARSVANTGFVIWRASKKTKIFLEALVGLMPIMMWRACDQLLINSALRNWRFRQLHYETFPRELILDLHTEDGKGGTASWISNKTMVIHAVGGNKENKLFMVGHWFFNRTCPKYFFRELDERVPHAIRRQPGYE
ncbi:hypothetical protein CYMTET_43677 [Cymbomonas tetramitiformis]|uniref:Nucleotide-diphospho-sugar transferase domain-containing protein n=1 Tax=Cymbomonas tetramitiformis TaxID=36881 RepID=A0AAE0C1P6_9CHLO|nr:hypothetical protein CYMTET_43678 [Cymbomonas tetramitiformis]KAK3246801.1 hypothetical protein CYMTET_43677 [Cymbomonas tetramitiformis]